MDANNNDRPQIKVSIDDIIKYAKYFGFGVLGLFVFWFFVEGCKSKVASWKEGIYQDALNENSESIKVLIDRAVSDTLASMALMQVEKYDYQKSTVRGQTKREIIKQKFYEKTGIKANDKTIDRVIDARKADSLKGAIEMRRVNRISNQ